MAGTPDYITLTINNYPLTDLSVIGEGISLGISDANTDGSSYYRFYFEYTGATAVELTISAKGYQTQTFTATVGWVDSVTLIPSYIDNIQTEDGAVYKLRTKTSELENDSNFATNDLANLSTDGKTLASSFAFPSGTYTDLTLGASNARYTAPANGWVYISWWTTSTTVSYINLANVTKGIASLIVPNQGSAYQFNTFIPCQKGDILAVVYSNIENASDTTHTKLFRFIYAEGAK